MIRCFIVGSTTPKIGVTQIHEVYIVQYCTLRGRVKGTKCTIFSIKYQGCCKENKAQV